MDRWIQKFFLCVMIGLLSACQMIPPAKGLPNLSALAQYTAAGKQDQVDIFWKDQSFTFLLDQQQYPDYLQVLALSLTGQVLFELHYDGQQIRVIQRIDAMRRLPLDYILRDIWWGTLATDVIQAQTQALGLVLQEQTQPGFHRMILANNIAQLEAQRQEQQVIINNYKVPYKMLITPSENNFWDGAD